MKVGTGALTPGDRLQVAEEVVEHVEDLGFGHLRIAGACFVVASPFELLAFFFGGNLKLHFTTVDGGQRVLSGVQIEVSVILVFPFLHVPI